jgi:Fur family ferric uptake transcriptional regulator
MMTSYENILRKNKLSLTSVRLAVLEALHTHPHSDAATVFEIVHKKIKTTSKQAIYNNLNALVERGIIREIKPKGQPSLYEAKVGDNHHHIICKNCHKIMDTDCHTFAPCLSPMNDHGFVIDEAEVTFWGICPACQKASNPKRRKS